MNDKETQATSALALGALFADDELRASVNAYVQGQVVETIYQMIKARHPMLQHLSEHVIDYANQTHYSGRYEAARRYAEEQEMRAKLHDKFAKAKPPKF